MKTILVTCLSLVLLIPAAELLADVRTDESWTETFPVTGDTPTLELSNVWGDVIVRPGSADEMLVHIREVRSAPDQARFDRSLDLLALQISSDGDDVSILVGDSENRWHSFQKCRGCRVEYQFEVFVPANTQLKVSTVNDGEVDVEGIRALVSASNVNGSVSVTGLLDCKSVNSVNGEITLRFTGAPGRNCEIETVNGDVVLSLPDDSAMNVAVDVFNGKILSEFPVAALALPATVEHIESNGHHRYQIKQSAGISIAGGGPTFTISSLNGDIRIQKIN
jgi:hypothetical protein